MDDETRSKASPSSRRRFLAASIGGGAAVVAAALAGPERALAADGGNVILGSSSNVATNTTVITVGTPDYSALWGNSTATTGVSVGVRGDADSSQGAGVLGQGGGYGV